MVVWWSWNYTTWVTNELDPESPVVRLLMIALMLASLMMAVAIPHAFGDDALLFVGSYVAIQVGRHAFLTFAAAGAGTIERERAGRILTWFGDAAGPHAGRDEVPRRGARGRRRAGQQVVGDRARARHVRPGGQEARALDIGRRDALGRVAAQRTHPV
jgi:hypothetical protein